ncbi:hypothetical protein MTP99_018989 [Tenebrio molitor]|jgi:hypothetical protein|uniref:uncharacterized protein n=1 Tax=Tenebrio molitor TaxID=7067 RepID=UPI001C3B186B|nr:hypothetical protein MTP99_018989 [Tenebrio molitor]CAH1377589.1 unnamed protein product [Tenebrio molitor]
MFHSIQLNFNVIWLVLLGIYSRGDIIMAHQCYVCGSNANISCDKFDPTNKSFIKDCPSAKACSIQTHGNEVERSCEDRKLRDCQTANNIQYCYCYENLCNGKTISFTDDEDLTEEGSGTTVITNTIKNEQKSNITNQSSHIQLHFYSTYITILAIHTVQLRQH